MRSANDESRHVGIVESLRGAANDLLKIGTRPSCLQKEIVSPPERQ